MVTQTDVRRREDLSSQLSNNRYREPRTSADTDG